MQPTGSPPASRGPTFQEVLRVPTGGSALVAALRALDVDVAFGLPGVHNLAA